MKYKVLRDKIFLKESSATILLIAILMAISIFKLWIYIKKAQVAKTRYRLGVVRTRLTIDSLLDNYPDLVRTSINNKERILNRYGVEETYSFTKSNGIRYEATNKIVPLRDNTGGWYYTRKTGEFYANLPDGAYTGDQEHEIWDDFHEFPSNEVLPNKGFKILEELPDFKIGGKKHEE